MHESGFCLEGETGAPTLRERLILIKHRPIARVKGVFKGNRNVQDTPRARIHVQGGNMVPHPQLNDKMPFSVNKDTSRGRQRVPKEIGLASKVPCLEVAKYYLGSRKREGSLTSRAHQSRPLETVPNPLNTTRGKWKRLKRRARQSSRASSTC